MENQSVLQAEKQELFKTINQLTDELGKYMEQVLRIERIERGEQTDSDMEKAWELFEKELVLIEAQRLFEEGCRIDSSNADHFRFGRYSTSTSNPDRRAWGWWGWDVIDKTSTAIKSYHKSYVNDGDWFMMGKVAERLCELTRAEGVRLGKIKK